MKENSMKILLLLILVVAVSTTSLISMQPLDWLEEPEKEFELIYYNHHTIKHYLIDVPHPWRVKVRAYTQSIYILFDTEEQAKTYIDTLTNEMTRLNASESYIIYHDLIEDEDWQDEEAEAWEEEQEQYEEESENQTEQQQQEQQEQPVTTDPTPKDITSDLVIDGDIGFPIDPWLLTAGIVIVVLILIFGRR